MRKYNEDGMKFIIVAYLGIDSGDLKKVNDPKVLKKIVSQCSNKAYQDLKRRVPYRYSISRIKSLEKTERDEYCLKKEDFIKEIKRKIVDGLVDEDGLVASEKMCPRDIIQRVWSVQENYSGLFSEENPFTIGLAQKWVNMTIKYVWALGILDENYEEKIDMPIDGYIINKINKEEKDIDVPNNAWSKWNNFAEYERIQDSLTEELRNIEKTRIRWENDAWIDETIERNSKKS